MFRNKHNSVIFWNISLLGFALTGFEIITGTWFFGNVKPPNASSVEELIVDRSAVKSSYGKIKYKLSKNFTRVYTPPSNIRSKEICSILLIGGSTTEQRILKDEETWGWKLWRDLNNNPSTSRECSGGVKLINAGISGHSISSNIYDIKYWLNRSIKNVDIVILYQGINDNHKGFNNYNLKRKIARKFKDQYYGIIYHSSIYKIYKSFQSMIGKDNEIRTNNLNLEISKGLKQGIRTNTIEINKDQIVEIYNTPNSKNYRKNIYQFLKTVENIYGANVIIITQTFPHCDLREDHEISYFSNKLLPDIKSIGNLNLLNISADEYLNTSLGRCLRVKLNRDNQKMVLHTLNSTMKSNIKLLDYATLNKANLDLLEYDLYHKSPRTSSMLYQDFKKLGIIKTVNEFFSYKN